MKQEQKDVFLLTKPPLNPRSDLCLKIVSSTGNVRLYLVGDGVYHLLIGIEGLLGCKIYACKEDLEARAIKVGENITVPDDFYATLIDDIMENCRHEYTF